MLKILSKEKDVSNGVPQKSDLPCGITIFPLMTMMIDFMCLFNLSVAPIQKELQAHWMRGLKFKRNLTKWRNSQDKRYNTFE